MVKIVLVVFSIAMLFTIQLVVGHDVKGQILTPEQENSLYHSYFEEALNNLADAGVVDRKILGDPHTIVQMRKAIELAEAKDPISDKMSTEEKELQCKEGLKYLVEEMSKAGLIDHDTVYKKLFTHDEAARKLVEGPKASHRKLVTDGIN